MRFRSSIVTGFFACVVGLGAVLLWTFLPRSAPSRPHFEAHEFALFSSEYERLRVQSPDLRAEHFRSLEDTAEAAKLTPGMRVTLAEFCQKVASSEDEATEVRTEARRAAQALEGGAEPSREPASVDRHP